MPARLRRDLDRRLQQLRLDPLVATRSLAEDFGVARRELEALGVDELELLLDAEREGRAGAVVTSISADSLYAGTRCAVGASGS